MADNNDKNKPVEQGEAPSTTEKNKPEVKEDPRAEISDELVKNPDSQLGYGEGSNDMTR